MVLRAPRGFGKSSTAAEWLRRPDLPDRDVVWVSLPPRPTSGPAFWRTVHLAIERAGLAEAVTEEGWDGLALAARERRRRLVLVVDGLDRVEDRRVDDELVALVQAHEELHLVLVMRAQRPVEALARVAVDTVVLTREHLALDAAFVADLARRTGRPVRPEEARWLAGELGGWPGLLRAALLTAGRGPDDELVLDTAALADYVRLVLQDDELAAVAQDLTALAVPERVTEDVAAHLVGRHVLPDALARARAAGLVAGEGLLLAYPTVVRDLLRRILREDSPARYRELIRAMMEHRRLAGDALAALRHAVSTQEPDAVLAVVDQGWGELAATRPWRYGPRWRRYRWTSWRAAPRGSSPAPTSCPSRSPRPSSWPWSAACARGCRGTRPRSRRARRGRAPTPRCPRCSSSSAPARSSTATCCAPPTPSPTRSGAPGATPPARGGAAGPTRSPCRPGPARRSAWPSSGTLTRPAATCPPPPTTARSAGSRPRSGRRCWPSTR